MKSKPVFPRLRSLCKELRIEKEEVINFLIVKGHDKTLLKGNFILSNQMHKEILTHYNKESKRKNSGIVKKDKLQIKNEEIPLSIAKSSALNKTLRTNKDGNINPPRLMAAAKEFNIGKDTLVDFLISEGFDRNDLKPTAKLTVEMYKALAFEFRGETLYDKPVQILDNHKLTIAIGSDGKFIVKYYDEAGVAYEKEIQKNLAGIYVSAFNKYSEIIKEFEDLINDPATKEVDLQKFLEKHPEFLKDINYKEVIPQALITTDDSIEWKADFVLVPFNQLQFCKILELKLPQSKINQKKKSGHTTFSSKLYKAIQQLKDYSKAFQSKHTKNIFYKRYNVEVFYPDLQLVIGRSGDINFKEEFMNIQNESGVKISDWDTYLDNVKRKFT